jgi:hypothetical protein
MPQEAIAENLPWWKVKMTWLVIGGPAAVVVAGFATLFIAMNVADPIVDTGPKVRAATSEAPAAQARNHAASPKP